MIAIFREDVTRTIASLWLTAQSSGWTEEMTEGYRLALASVALAFGVSPVPRLNRNTATCNEIVVVRDVAARQ